MSEISLETRRELVRKYFIPLPKSPIRAHIKLGIAVLFLLLGLAGGSGVLAFIGFAILIWAGVGYAKYMSARMAAKPRAADPQMDEWLYGRIPQIVEYGKGRLNIHPTELGSTDDKDCLPFIGIPGENDGSYLQGRGEDGVLRFSAYKIMVVYLSNWRLPVYE